MCDAWAYTKDADYEVEEGSFDDKFEFIDNKVMRISDTNWKQKLIELEGLIK